MKIEKITENKIRVIINSEDLDENNTDIHALMTKSLETQDLFLEMLDRAEEEVGFYTEGCKLLIEAFSSIDGFLVFTITKSKKSDCKPNTTSKKLIAKRKSSTNYLNKQLIYSFGNFEQFCDLCRYLSKINNFEIKKISKNISLYLYNNTYYLIFDNVNIKYEFLKQFHFTILEFGKLLKHSESFKNKLLEHGKYIIKKDAIHIGIDFFIT